jgi:hypothetical protein
MALEHRPLALLALAIAFSGVIWGQATGQPDRIVRTGAVTAVIGMLLTDERIFYKIRYVRAFFREGRNIKALR